MSMPPIIGAAMRLITSEPAPWPRRIGSRPTRITATVITLGCPRSSALAHRMANLLARWMIAGLGECNAQGNQHLYAELGGDAGERNASDRCRDPRSRTIGNSRGGMRPGVSGCGLRDRADLRAAACATSTVQCGCAYIFNAVLGIGSSPCLAAICQVAAVACDDAS